jgi:hypothetical protein
MNGFKFAHGLEVASVDWAINHNLERAKPGL